MNAKEIEKYLAELGNELNLLNKALQIQSKEQAQTLIDFYIPEREIQYLLSIPETLDKFFPPK